MSVRRLKSLVGSIGKRDHGGLLFVDLRDHYGLIQCVLTPENEHFSKVEHMRVESVLTFTGKTVARQADAINPNLDTGAIEIQVAEVEVQSEAAELAAACVW